MATKTSAKTSAKTKGADYDLAVVGGGPGGYVAAIRAAQLGMRVACIEKRPTLGGTCLNIGCIPSKALLSASEHYHAARGGGLKVFGVRTEGVSLDMAAMQKHKSKVVTANTKGVEFLLKKNGVDWIKGEAVLQGTGRLSVGGETCAAKNIVLATGSEATALPGVAFDEKRVVSSTGALEFTEPPKRLVVIGGGYIGLELGCVWARLGSEVIVVEFLDRILPGMDGEVSAKFKPILEKQGLKFKLSTRVDKVESGASGVRLTLSGADGGKAETLEADAVLVAVGRRAFASGAEAVGVALDKRGCIITDADFRTKLEGVYAIGDAIAGPMLAHKAEEEGVALAERLAGGAGLMHYHAIPGIVYTDPEAASVGETEESLKAAGVAYKAGRFPFLANGRARAMNATDGFVKILADAKSDRILGAHILGADAGSLIHEVVLVMSFGGSAEDLARTCHGHPTLNEVVKEAALAVADRAIHS